MSQEINMDKVKEEMRNLVAEISEKPIEEIKDDARFSEDLGIDSMMALEIVASIEKKYKVVIPEAEIPNMRSLQNVYDLLGKISGK
ncbi:MAG: acyl carrier protein [Candidatus Omnitrophota bacterium]|jgi:acyl carrier protein